MNKAACASLMKTLVENDLAPTMKRVGTEYEVLVTTDPDEGALPDAVKNVATGAGAQVRVFGARFF